MTNTESPPSSPSLETEGAKFFASLVRNMLEEHEKKQLFHLQRLTALVDLLVHDARGLHLQVAAQEASLARVQVTISDLTARVSLLEASVHKLLGENTTE